jgi:hypothetical protein
MALVIERLPSNCKAQSSNLINNNNNKKPKKNPFGSSGVLNKVNKIMKLFSNWALTITQDFDFCLVCLNHMEQLKLLFT